MPTEQPSPLLNLADEILASLEGAASRTSTELRAGSEADSIVWTIIVGFLASVAANLFTKGLPQLGPHRLGDKDLAEIERVFERVVRANHEFQQERIETAVRSQLPTYLSAQERTRLTSEISCAIIKACQKERI